MKMNTYISGPIDANNYLIWDETSKEAALIDCSEFKDVIVEDIKEHNLNLKYILLTHGHFDHVMGINEMAEVTGAKVALNKSDTVLLDNINEYCKLLGLPDVEIPRHDMLLDDGTVLKLGNMEIKSIYTSGHTEGGLCYLVENNLFSGDTLFRDCYGRTDLFGGDFSKIKVSLKDILFKLDNSITVYPGHGDSTTIGYEKLHNEINR